MTDFMKEVKKEGRSCTVTLNENSDLTGYDTNGNQTDFYGYFDKENNSWHDTEFIDNVIQLAAGNEYKLSDDFIEENKIKYEMLTGKELLDDSLEILTWKDFYSFNPDFFAKKLPETFCFQLVFTIPSKDKRTEGDGTCQIKLEYPDMNWESHSLIQENNISGGKWIGNSIVLISNDQNEATLTVSIDKENSQNIEGHGLYIQGCNLILKSLKILENRPNE